MTNLSDHSTILYYRDRLSPFLETTFYMIGILVIIYGAIDTFIFIYNNYTRENVNYEYFVWDIRIRLSSSFTLALTYILGAEIIKTFRIPNIEQLIKITALLLVRQLITYFLDNDVHNLRKISHENRFMNNNS